MSQLPRSHHLHPQNPIPTHRQATALQEGWAMHMCPWSSRSSTWLVVHGPLQSRSGERQERAETLTLNPTDPGAGIYLSTKLPSVALTPPGQKALEWDEVVADGKIE